MPFRKAPSMGSAGIARVAQGWGKVVARRVEEEVGPDLDLDADQIEQFAKGAACAELVGCRGVTPEAEKPPMHSGTTL